MADNVRSMARHLVIAMLLCIVTALAAQSPPPPPSPTVTAKIEHNVSRVENTQPEHTNSPSHISPTIINQATANTTQENTNPKRDTRQHTTPFNWSRLNTALLTLFTGILAIVGFLQWRSMSKQAGYMRDGLKVTSEAADAAKKSAEAVVITERAAVFVDSVIGTPPYAIGGLLGVGNLTVDSKVVFTLKNSGRTIARAVKLVGVLTGVGNFPIDESPPKATIIAPQGTNSWTTKPLRDWPIDDELLKGINAGWPVLQYKIDVTYADDFKRYTYHCEGKYEPALQRFSITASSEGEASD